MASISSIVSVVVFNFLAISTAHEYWWIDSNMSTPSQFLYVSACNSDSLCSRSKTPDGYLTLDDRNFDLFDSRDTFLRSLESFPFCYCDDECQDYGDCCIGLNYRNEHKLSPWSCLQLNAHRISSKRQNEASVISVYVINKCPKATDDVLNSKCLQEQENNEYTYIMDTPVLSTVTNKMYANIFCAECNSDAASLSPWMLTIECLETSDSTSILSNTLISEIIESDEAIYVARDMYWTLNGTSVKCGLSIQEFEEPISFIKKSKSRRCVKSIDSCPTYHQNSISCDKYSSLVIDQQNNIYKNMDCAKCNDVNEISCYKASLERITNQVDQKSYSIDVKIDFKGRSWCSKHEIYDPVRKRCLILCRDGLIERNGTCIQNIKTEDTNSISSCLKVLSNSLLGFNCLSLSFNIFISVKKSKVNFLQKSLRSLNISLLLGNLLLIILVNTVKLIGFVPSIILCSLLHYFVLSSFSWLSIVIYDRYRLAQLKLVKVALFKCCLFAWTIPVFLIALSIALSFFYSTSAADCQHAYWYAACSSLWGTTTYIAFFVCPVAFSLLVDALLLLRAVHFVINRSIEPSSFDESVTFTTHHLSKTRLKFGNQLAMSAGLVIVMGISWLCVFVSVLGDSQYFMFPFTILNGLQGIYVFIAFYSDALKRCLTS